jgi:hypothetical protein
MPTKTTLKCEICLRNEMMLRKIRKVSQKLLLANRHLPSGFASLVVAYYYWMNSFTGWALQEVSVADALQMLCFLHVANCNSGRHGDGSMLMLRSHAAASSALGPHLHS